MSAFDGKTKIGRKVADPITDHTLPNSRSLAWKAITTPLALKGTNGTHCELVHGDQWNEMKGNQTENIARNQTLKVIGKHKQTLVESCYQNIIGPQIVTNQNVVNETRMGVHTEVYGINTKRNSNDGILSYADNNLSANTFYWATNLLKLEADGINVTLGGAYVTGWALRIPLGLISYAAWVDNINSELTKLRLAELYVDVVGLDSQLAALHSDVTARVHALPSVGPTPPLAPH